LPIRELAFYLFVDHVESLVHRVESLVDPPHVLVEVFFGECGHTLTVATDQVLSIVESVVMKLATKVHIDAANIVAPEATSEGKYVG
jgi:hypothetical protein